MKAEGRGAGATRLLLTRSEEDCTAWAAELGRRGLETVSLPCITAEPIDSPALRRALAGAAAGADWLAFTSRRGVEAYARLTGETSTPLKVAVVGAATAEAARRTLGRVDLVAEHGTARGLARTLAEALREARGGETGARIAMRARGSSALSRPRAAPSRPQAAPSRPRVLAAVAENARDTLGRELAAAGITCLRVDVYRTVPAETRGAKRPLASFGVDAVLLASPSAVQGFANQVDIDSSAPLVTIGPSTSAAVRALGLQLAAQAREPSLEGLLEAMKKWMKGMKKGSEPFFVEKGL